MFSKASALQQLSPELHGQQSQRLEASALQTNITRGVANAFHKCCHRCMASKSSALQQLSLGVCQKFATNITRGDWPSKPEPCNQAVSPKGLKPVVEHVQLMHCCKNVII